MLNLYKTIEVVISLQILIISTMIPVFITIPITNKVLEIVDIPITWQIPSVILITLVFRGKIVFKAFSIYLLLGIFFIPIFHHGGSLGYILTPNFGYLLGIYPLIKIIDDLNKDNKIITVYKFIKYGIIGITFMHIIGITYSSIQMIYFKRYDYLLYSISNYSFGKYGYHLLMLTPISLLLSPINNFRYQKS